MLLVKKRMGLRDTAIDFKAHFVMRKKFGMALFYVTVRNTEKKIRFLTIGRILLFILSFFLSGFLFLGVVECFFFFSFFSPEQATGGNAQRYLCKTRRTCLITISKLFFTAVPIPPVRRASVCVCVCVGC